eukprot:CAMPEP_0167786252 /NCGR_PEP_ID=MMETSP0111_2-20121227/8680_1 /TAXON_ID=91324 /ORGANISM="Lotharella globosa, Strain CCCM811" /LENGTH=194 /DNA_ID=CAMNT_0007677595 /DNA_START=78 /DNA_END=662 /DNA_ORIENTATION=-
MIKRGNPKRKGVGADGKVVGAASSGCACTRGEPCDRQHAMDCLDLELLDLGPDPAVKPKIKGTDKYGGMVAIESLAPKPTKKPPAKIANKPKRKGVGPDGKTVNAQSSGCACTRGESCDRQHAESFAPVVPVKMGYHSKKKGYNPKRKGYNPKRKGVGRNGKVVTAESSGCACTRGGICDRQHASTGPISIDEL